MGKELKIAIGLPGSGKSTWALQFVKDNPNFIRVNRDTIRLMCGFKWNPKHEKYVEKLRDVAIEDAFLYGFSVVCDDTNLSPKVQNHLKQLAEKNNAQFSTQDFTDVPLEVCLERDSKREAKVGKQVIMRMYYQFLHKPVSPPEYDFNLPNALICDLDGTLAIIDGKRNPYDASKCDETDDVNHSVLSFINLAKQAGYIILFVSGRMDKDREPTERFISKKCGIYPNTYVLLMRKTGDQRKDTEVKLEIYENFIKNRYNVKWILDDRPSVVRLWQSLGFTVFNVGLEGREF